MFLLLHSPTIFPKYKLMKRIILLLVAFTEFSVMAQTRGQIGHVSDFISLDTIIPFRNEKTGIYSDLTYSKWEDEVVFTNFSSQNNNDTIIVYRIKSLNACVDTFKLYEKGLCKTMQSYYERNLSALVYSPETILIKYADKISMYKKLSEHSYKKEKSYRFEENFREIRLLNDSIAFGVNFYYSHPEAFTLFFFNINDGRIVKKILPEYERSSILLSFFQPSNIMDVWNGIIALTERGKYVVRVYDETLTCVDSIVCRNGDWTTLSKGTVDRVMSLDRHNAADIIDILRTEYDSVDNIQHLFFLDSDKIAVSHARKTSQGASISPKLDIWQKKPQGWKIIQASIYDDGYRIKDSVFSRNRIPIGLGTGNKICFMANGKIVVLSKRGDGVDNPVGMAMKEYGRQVNDFLLDNDYYVQCLIFTQTFNAESK